MGIQNADGPVQIGTWNGFGAGFEPGTFDLQPQTVYNLWIDVKNDPIADGDLVSIHIAKDGNASRTTLFQDYRSDRNPAPDPGDLIGYPAKPDLRTLTVGGNTADSLVYFDDFYLSKSGYNSTVPRVFGFTTPVAPVVVAPKLSIGVSGSQVEITFSGGTLESSSDLAGPWNTVTDATGTSYKVTPTGGRMFYRVRQ